jgi:methionyl-tRNA formyltransferase
LERGVARAHAQNNFTATYANKIGNDETQIDWSKTATEVDCLIRGLSPQPGAWTMCRGERLKLLDCELVHSFGDGAAGEALDDHLAVACGNGAIRLTRLQRPGRAPMGAESLLRGHAIPSGTRFS